MLRVEHVPVAEHEERGEEREQEEDRKQDARNDSVRKCPFILIGKVNALQVNQSCQEADYKTLHNQPQDCSVVENPAQSLSRFPTASNGLAVADDLVDEAQWDQQGHDETKRAQIVHRQVMIHSKLLELATEAFALDFKEIPVDFVYREEFERCDCHHGLENNLYIVWWLHIE